MNGASITAIILTYNEELHIERCIKSLENIVQKIIIVDSFSIDKTVEIAKELGAEVYQNTWVNYAAQFQWGLDNGKINTDWVMRIDADEYFSSSAPDILKTLAQMPESTTGVYIKRKYYFLGQWIKHGAMHPIYVLRLWRNTVGRIENRWMDEHIVLEHGDSVIVDAEIVDDNKNSISWWIDKHNSYATREMIDILNIEYRFLKTDDLLKDSGTSQAASKRLLKENVYSKLPLFFRSFLYFFYRYVFKVGFLDGTKGFAFHSLQGYWYRSLVDLKLYEAKIWIGDTKDPEVIRKILSEKTGHDLQS